jgi:hypothetical protein
MVLEKRFFSGGIVVRIVRLFFGFGPKRISLVFRLPF